MCCRFESSLFYLGASIHVNINKTQTVKVP
jgi:hypothetical protein